MWRLAERSPKPGRQITKSPNGCEARMDALWNGLQNGFILMAGLAVRFAIALALFAVLLAILVPIVYASEGVRRLFMRLTGFEPVAGLNWRRHTYYSPAHAWLRG